MTLILNERPRTKWERDISFQARMARPRTRWEKWQGLKYQVSNLPKCLSETPRNLRIAAARMMGVPMFTTELRATIHNPDGTSVDCGVLSRRIVTTAGVNYLASTFLNTAEPETINYHDSGTGATAEVIGNTTMQTATGNARVAGTQSNPSANIYQSAATLSYTATAAITEWGIFSASTVGTLFDRFTFAALNVVNGSSITFTFALTFTAGG